SFFGNVRVLNIPAPPQTNKQKFVYPEYNLNLIFDQLPKNAMYLTADRLDVISHKLPIGKSYQEMEAQGHVTVTANEFWATCNTLHYDESKDQIIFYGDENGPATLDRSKVPGARSDRVAGKTILYNRRTGEWRVVEGETFRGR